MWLNLGNLEAQPDDESKMTPPTGKGNPSTSYHTHYKIKQVTLLLPNMCFQDLTLVKSPGVSQTVNTILMTQ